MTKKTKGFCWHQNSIPLVLSSPAPGYIRIYKIVGLFLIKSDMKVILLIKKKFSVTKALFYHQTLSAMRYLPLPRGVYITIKSWRILLKIWNDSHPPEIHNIWLKWQRLSVAIKSYLPRGYLSLHKGWHTCIKSRNIYIKLWCMRFFWNLQQTVRVTSLSEINKKKYQRNHLVWS